MESQKCIKPHTTVIMIFSHYDSHLHLILALFVTLQKQIPEDFSLCIFHSWWYIDKCYFYFFFTGYNLNLYYKRIKWQNKWTWTWHEAHLRQITSELFKLLSILMTNLWNEAGSSTVKWDISLNCTIWWYKLVVPLLALCSSNFPLNPGCFWKMSSTERTE